MYSYSITTSNVPPPIRIGGGKWDNITPLVFLFMLPRCTLFSCISYPFFLGHFSSSAKFCPCTTIARSCQCRFGKNFFE